MNLTIHLLFAIVAVLVLIRSWDDTGWRLVGAAAIVCISGCIGCGLVSDLSGHTHEVAQREADAFISAMRLDVRARCADTDSDGDGYVSCPMVYKDGRIEALKCAGAFTVNSGCQPPKAVVRRR